MKEINYRQMAFSYSNPENILDRRGSIRKRDNDDGWEIWRMGERGRTAFVIGSVYFIIWMELNVSFSLYWDHPRIYKPNKDASVWASAHYPKPP